VAAVLGSEANMEALQDALERLRVERDTECVRADTLAVELGELKTKMSVLGM
jgi:hypothetical protein